MTCNMMISAFSTFCPLSAQVPKHSLYGYQIGHVNSRVAFQSLVVESWHVAEEVTGCWDVKLKYAGRASAVGRPLLYVLNK